MTKWVGFNRMLSNALRRIVQRNGGEFHGSYWQVAEALQLEIGGICVEQGVDLMKTHLFEVGGEALVADTELVFFRDYKTSELNFVERRLLDEPGN